MLSENIRNYRKKNNLSQDELAAKVGVSRQSVSFWENGQTQPTIDNIIALSRIFNISSDTLLGNIDSSNIPQKAPNNKPPKKSKIPPAAIAVAIVLIVGAVILVGVSRGGNSNSDDPSSYGTDSVVQTEVDTESDTYEKDDIVTSNTEPEATQPAITESNESVATTIDELTAAKTEAVTTAPAITTAPVVTTAETTTVDTTEAVTTVSIFEPVVEEFDIFTYCKEFAIEKGILNGDYAIYQQPATTYGGYENEYFSISYWADSNMVEFCLHCPLSEMLSHNFYLRMRGGYDGEYEYLSSKYFRDTGEGLRSAYGHIDPSVFSDQHPINCEEYDGSFDGQNEFMEDTRVGICDLIRCLKEFVTVEDMDCDFSDFEFVNFQ